MTFDKGFHLLSQEITAHRYLALNLTNIHSPMFDLCGDAIFDFLKVTEVCLVNVVPARAYIVPAPNSCFPKLNMNIIKANTNIDTNTDRKNKSEK